MFKLFIHVSTSNASTNDTAKAQKRMEMNEKKRLYHTTSAL